MLFRSLTITRDIAQIRGLIEALSARMTERLSEIDRRCAFELHAREIVEQRIRGLEMDESIADKMGKLVTLVETLCLGAFLLAGNAFIIITIWSLLTQN